MIHLCVLILLPLGVEMIGKHELKWRMARLLKQGRKGKKLTLEDVSKLLGIGKSKLSRMERGEQDFVTLYDWLLLANLFNLDPKTAWETP
jgi:hypothetical protein